LGVLSKKEGIILNNLANLDAGGQFPTRVDIATFGLDSKFDLLGEELLKKWEKKKGRFIGVSAKPVTGTQHSENPPFWLIKERGRDVFPDPMTLDGMGFAIFG
jgi:hypothetical protein